MHSIKTKLSAVTIGAVIIVMLVATVFGVIAIRNTGMSSAEQTLHMLCEAGEKNLNSAFEDVEQDVQTISAYVESDLDGVSDEKLSAHLDRVSDFFAKVISRTNGIMTYYYRIDPTLSEDVKGFWYVNLDGDGFKEHEVTDITQYDTEDTSQLVWFTVPKVKGESVWLPPYITDNLDVRVISYNIPVYYNKQFVGVIGIELDYSYMAQLVDNITLYENGYAFVNDKKGNIVYHPRKDVTTMDVPPEIPKGLDTVKKTIRYEYDGVEKMAYCLPLVNGNRLNVSVPLKEINARWHNWIMALVITFAVLLAAFIFIILKYTGKITKPLQELTKAAKQIDEGNYDTHLEYNGNDEIGILTRTFNRVTAHLKSYITDLNDLAYADALTSLHNKGAFDIFINNVQTEMNELGSALEFAVCMFDCNNLKTVNDENGHDKGDIYLKETAEVICEVFEHSPVFRIGGDEFAALLLGKDYARRDQLLEAFDAKCAERQAEYEKDWERVDVARGLAVYDPQEDRSVNDVVRRADRLMYENKWTSKRGRD